MAFEMALPKTLGVQLTPPLARRVEDFRRQVSVAGQAQQKNGACRRRLQAVCKKSDHPAAADGRQAGQTQTEQGEAGRFGDYDRRDYDRRQTTVAVADKDT